MIRSETFGLTTRAGWRDYIEITKPGINKSNLIATFAGYFVAAEMMELDFLKLFLTLLGTALTIAGSCVLNNFIDRDIDPLMERTKDRPVADGRIKPAIALRYGLTLALSGLMVLAAGVNYLTALIALSGLFVYIFIYTIWLKRSSTLNTVVGGMSGAVPPMVGWVAVTSSVDLNAWALFLVLFMWQPPHFFALAMRRSEDYRAAGIPMLPVVKGFHETKKQTLLFTALLLPSSLILFYTGALGQFYLAVALVLGGIYIALSIRGFFVKDDKQWANQMFFYSLIYLTAILLAMVADVLISDLIPAI
ncbi:protoheme IX farnesyltransferase [Thermoactinomyces sp. AMNI-1]|uniref:Protoheme IX farnesyltransferase n=2 Tax=Thermoactinomyces mirandus TaxID=2756294 RepID=A0A7W2AR15_9BACL|nr:protoheme IX farnesyltransferase [Thermoactinomyces mirandus]